MVIEKVILLSLLPISELRGAIPIGIAAGMKPFSVFLTAVIANSLVIPIVFFFLDTLHRHFYKIRYYQALFDKYIERTRKKFEKHAGSKWEFAALCIFVAVPLPMTGAYTGTVVAWLFNLDRKKSYLSLALGVLGAGIIVTLVSIGVKSIFNFF